MKSNSSMICVLWVHNISFWMGILSDNVFCNFIRGCYEEIYFYTGKGSYSGMKGNNPEILIEDILNGLKIPFEKGDLNELIDKAPDSKRTMDFIIPNKQDPAIIAESSFLTTTSSGQGDKSKTEISMESLIEFHYPKAKFIGFVDGIGWYVRKGDLRRMVAAYEDVFTFHKEELRRFEKFLVDIVNNKQL